MGTALLHSGISLTVTGVSRCVSVEAYAAVSLAVGLGGGAGLALAFDAPIVAEACGLGAVAAVEDVDVRVEGRGLLYSSRPLAAMLAEIVNDAYAEGEADIDVESVVERFLASYELPVASLAGSSVVVAGARFPLLDLAGYWVVAIRQPAGLAAVDSILFIDEYKVYDVLDLGVEGLDSIGRLQAEALGPRALSLRRRLLREGAEAVVFDAYGGLVLAVVEGAERAFIVSSRLRGLGRRFEAPIVA